MGYAKKIPSRKKKRFFARGKDITGSWMTKIGQETRNTMVLLKKMIFGLESVFSIFKKLFLFPKP